MDAKLEELRGEEARRVLDAEIYKEAFKAITDRIVSQLTLAELPDDKRKRLNDLLVAHTKARQYMEQVLISGTMAAQEIERQQTLTERVEQKWRQLRA